MRTRNFPIIGIIFFLAFSFSGCDVLRTVSAVNQIKGGNTAVVKGDPNLPGAQKNGVKIEVPEFKEVHKPAGVRYRDPVFKTVDRTTEVYIQNAKHFNGSTSDLKMDIYTPAGDSETGRPCVIFVFGGGFFMKNVGGMEQMGRGFAMKGYVGVSIDYRIGFENATSMFSCKTNFSGFDEAWYRAAQDAKAAIRYVKANADRLGIDKNKIFIGGHSAGAFTTLNAVQLDDKDVSPELMKALGDVNASGAHQNENTDVMGCFILAGGAIHTMNYIDKPVPTYLLMGTCDQLLNNGKGRIYKCDNPMYPEVYTGQSIYDKLRGIGACVHYDVSCKGDHEFGGIGWFGMYALAGNFIYETLMGSCKSDKRGVNAPKAVCQQTDASVCK